MSVLFFILSAVCIAVANICIEGFLIGKAFHGAQALTPQTWRPESYKSYIYSTLLSILFGFLFTFFYLKIGSHYVIGHSVLSDIKLAVICFGCFSLIPEVANAIYINYDRKFVAGKLLASGLSYAAAAVIAGLFYWR